MRLVLGAVEVKPGDWLYADRNGVLVSEHELQLTVSQAA
ncbi:MAG: hypothetical protein CM15mP74_01810 [Halieaceae bacterium]|nr:MAG: hypothetical protein CM15mP74_01810 [Halieaceae bacterium]